MVLLDVFGVLLFLIQTIIHRIILTGNYPHSTIRKITTVTEELTRMDTNAILSQRFLEREHCIVRVFLSSTAQNKIPLHS